MAKKKKISKRFVSYSWMLINTTTWGAAFVFIKPALSVTTPFRYMFYRCLVASVITFPVLLWYIKKIPKLSTTILTITAIELIGTTLGLSLLYEGLARNSAIEATLLAITAPIFITIGGVLFLKENEEFHEKIGLGVALIGTIILVAIPYLNSSIRSNGISFLGNLLIIGSNIASTAYFLLAKKRYHLLPKFFVTAVSFYVGMISFLILSLFEFFTTTQLPTINKFFYTIQIDLTYQSVWVAVLYMAFFGSIIGLTAYFKGQDGIEASEASLFTYLQPFVAIPLSIWLLNETVYPLQILALGIIFSGVYIAEKRWKKKPFWLFFWKRKKRKPKRYPKKV